VKSHGFHREAEEEYAVAATDYAKINPELGSRFYDEIERLIAEICRRPTLYRFIRRPIRRHISTTFPFGILYEDRPDEVRILAVMPLHRDPNYWLHRDDD
jgi:toxin ParE1/3/4